MFRGLLSFTVLAALMVLFAAAPAASWTDSHAPDFKRRPMSLIRHDAELIRYLVDDSDFPVIAAPSLWEADFNQDGIGDYLVVVPHCGCGLAFFRYTLIFLLSDGSGRFVRTEVTDFYFEPEDLIVDRGRNYLILTAFLWGEKTGHYYWNYRILDFGADGFMQEADQRVGAPFPAFIWYTFGDNHKLSARLTADDRKRMWQTGRNVYIETFALPHVRTLDGIGRFNYSLRGQKDHHYYLRNQTAEELAREVAGFLTDRAFDALCRRYRINPEPPDEAYRLLGQAFPARAFAVDPRPEHERRAADIIALERGTLCYRDFCLRPEYIDKNDPVRPGGKAELELNLLLARDRRWATAFQRLNDARKYDSLLFEDDLRALRSELLRRKFELAAAARRISPAELTEMELTMLDLRCDAPIPDLRERVHAGIKKRLAATAPSSVAADPELKRQLEQAITRP